MSREPGISWGFDGFSSVLAAAGVRAALFAAALTFTASGAGAAPQTWTLDPATSMLTYQSVKKNTIVETNTIRNITGTITPDGAATVKFDLNSVDTGVDLRNVRMRFLFFETFKYPTATLTAKVDPAAFADLATKRRMIVTLPFELDLHGVKKDLEAQVVVTMITDTMVSVASRARSPSMSMISACCPMSKSCSRQPSVEHPAHRIGDVRFRFSTARGEAAKRCRRRGIPRRPPRSGPVATDTSKATYSGEECVNRFEVLSRTGSIYFRIASAKLDSASRPVLDAVLDVVTKCPQLKVEVSGLPIPTATTPRTSACRSGGPRRLRSSSSWRVPPPQMTAVGYGESRPFVANDTDKNKGLNRRIEFSASPMATSRPVSDTAKEAMTMSEPCPRPCPGAARAAMAADAASAWGKIRVALVLGNSAYEHAPPLANPVNDAEAISKSVKGLGFEVVEGFDLTKAQTQETIARFAKTVRGAEIALFFYAGHGMQVAGSNYLLPVDAALEDETSLDFEAVQIDFILRQMSRENRGPPGLPRCLPGQSAGQGARQGQSVRPHHQRSCRGPDRKQRRRYAGRLCHQPQRGRL